MLISLVFFMAVLKGHELGLLHWIPSALLVTIAPFVMNNFVGIIRSGTPFSPEYVFTPSAVIILATQVILAVIFFRYMEAEKGGGVVKWLVAASIGFFLLYLVIPFLVDRIPLPWTF